MLKAIPAHHKQAVAFLRTVKPGSARQEIPDATLPGLYFVQQPTGGRSWAVRSKIGARSIKVTLGKHDEGERPARDNLFVNATQILTIVEARTLGAQVLLDLKRGVDPKDRADRNELSADYWLGEFIITARTKGVREGKGPVKPQTADEYQRIINTCVKPHWKHVSDVRTLDYHDVEKLLDKLPTGARRNTFAVLSAFFRWKRITRLIGRNVIEPVDAPAIPRARERILTHEEIKSVWNAADKCGYPFGPMVQLLILTGQRRDEIANLKWSELSASGDAIILDGVRTKNGSAHIVPLAATASEIIGKLPKIKDRAGNESAFLFTTTGATPFSGFSNAKRALDKHCNEPAMPDWRLHDLRRTCATELAKLEIKQEVTEAILNHKSGKVSGIAAIYNRYDYQSEKIEALKIWDEKLLNILS